MSKVQCSLHTSPRIHLNSFLNKLKHLVSLSFQAKLTSPMQIQNLIFSLNPARRRFRDFSMSLTVAGCVGKIFWLRNAFQLYRNYSPPLLLWLPSKTFPSKDRSCVLITNSSFSYRVESPAAFFFPSSSSFFCQVKIECDRNRKRAWHIYMIS